MDIFLLIIVIVLLILLISKTNERLNHIESHLKALGTLLNRLKKESSDTDTQKDPVKEEVKPPVSKYAYIPPQPISEYKPEEKPIEQKPIEEVKKEEPVEQKIPDFVKTEITPPPSKIAFTPAPPKPVTPPQPGFFERNPDLEKFIGENLVNKIGIAVLVLGIGFFVKYAIDQDWINAVGRVAIGVLCGGILLGFAHYLRVKFKAFSSVLVGGGLAVLYFTIALAFHQYHIIDQTAAFIIMVVITGFAVLLSIAYNRIEIAVLSIIGGFCTPFIVSTGDGNYVVLFSYLTILNVGMLVLAYFKKWNLINILSYAFTILIYGGWVASKMGDTEAPYMGGLLFGTIFYLVFFLMNIINNVKEKRVFSGLDFALLISNTFLYYAASMYILHFVGNGEYEGLFTALLAAFNFVFAFTLYKNQSIDRNLVFLLIGLVLSFVSLAAPVQLHGHHITLFWAAEGVLLLWLSQRSGIKLMKLTSVIITVLMLISLSMDWYKIYYMEIGYPNATNSPFTIMLNKGFITGIVSVISLWLSAFFLKKENETSLYNWLDYKAYSLVLSAVGVVVMYLTFLFELDYQLYQRLQFSPECQTVLGLYNLLFVIGLNVWAMRKQNYVVSGVIGTISATLLLIYISYYNNNIISLRNDLLVGTNTSTGMYLFHYLTALAALGLTATLLVHIKKAFTLVAEIGIVSLLFISFISVYILSAELCHLIVVSGYNPKSPDLYIPISQATKIGYPVLWGICSLLLMVLGMRFKMRHLRIISLSLFFITLIKLFLFDIREISEAGKIIAFISLGILLLVVSFMYQKLKFLVIEDKENKPTDTHENA